MFDPEPLLTSGYEALHGKRIHDARDLFAQAVAECRWITDRSLLVKALRALGHVERDLDHRTTALQCYRRAAAIELDLGHRPLTGRGGVPRNHFFYRHFRPLQSINI